jgi:hypothetical protein
MPDDLTKRPGLRPDALPPLPAGLDAVERCGSAEFEALRRLRPAATEVYAALTPAQKRIADVWASCPVTDPATSASVTPSGERRTRPSAHGAGSSSRIRPTPLTGKGRKMTVSIMTPHASVRPAAIRIGSLAARALVALAFVVAGAANLTSTPNVIEMFEAGGVGPWLRYLVALVEVAGAAMLLLPGFIGLGALLLAAAMFCALLGHFFVLGDSPVETLALLAAAGAILWYRRREVLVLYRRHLDRRRLAGRVMADIYGAFFWLGLGICLAWSVMTTVAALEMFR